ncbi:MAG: hypothetical protein AB7P37_16945, partial [Ramlibacter sp.]
MPAVMRTALRRPGQARVLLPVASWRVSALHGVKRALQALQREAVTQPGLRPHLRVLVQATAQTLWGLARCLLPVRWQALRRV